MNQSYTRTTQRNKRNHSSGSRFLSFLLKYALPFIILNGFIFFVATSKPKLTAEVGNTDDYRTTSVNVRLKSALPTKQLKASMDDQEILLEKTDKKGLYTIEIEKNGILEISVSSINGMSTTLFESIDVLDDNPPAIASHYIEDGILTFELEDSQSGIDYSSIKATDSKGESASPLTMDKVKGTVTFTMDPDGLIVSVKDMSGHAIQATFTSHLEGGKEVSETSAAVINEEEETAPEA